MIAVRSSVEATEPANAATASRTALEDPPRRLTEVGQDHFGDTVGSELPAVGDHERGRSGGAASSGDQQAVQRAGLLEVPKALLAQASGDLKTAHHGRQELLEPGSGGINRAAHKRSGKRPHCTAIRYPQVTSN